MAVSLAENIDFSTRRLILVNLEDLSMRVPELWFIFAQESSRASSQYPVKTQ
jgi:hypothetical protein